MEDKTVQISAYIHADLYDSLKALADADDRSINYMVVMAVREFVKNRSFNARLAGKPSLLPASSGQMDLEDAIVAAVKAGPMTTAQKQAKARKNMAARATRMADRASKRK